MLGRREVCSLLEWCQEERHPPPRLEGNIHDRVVLVARSQLEGKAAEQLDQHNLGLRQGKVLQRRSTAVNCPGSYRAILVPE
jgi:hypothetical protein